MKKYSPYQPNDEEKQNFLSMGITLAPKGDADIDYKNYLKQEFPDYYNYNLHFIYSYMQYADKLQKKLTGNLFKANEKYAYIALTESIISPKINYFYSNKFNRIISIVVAVIKLYCQFIYQISTDSWWRRVWRKYLFDFIQTKFDKKEQIHFWSIIYFICLPLKMKILTIKSWLK